VSKENIKHESLVDSQNGGVSYETINVEHKGRVAVITLNRPKSLNALNSKLGEEVVSALRQCDKNMDIGSIVVTGSERAFAAGADIEEMSEKSCADMIRKDIFAVWDQVRFIKKPIIAAVAGYAIGGGCELALMCDFIIAAENAQFGQPEIKLGIMPGIGGTQRLPRAVGKALAMDMILTGRLIGAEEAKASGLVARVVPDADLLQTALDAAKTIAGYNAPAVAVAKDAINRSYTTSLNEGVKQERSLFQSMFATKGQKEGMKAFLEKRPPVFKNC